jgi:Flp pilus assembly protein TadD
MTEPKEFTRYLKKVTPEDLLKIEELLQESPRDLDILDWAAFANYSSGHYARAVELYRQCVELEPNSASFHYFLGSSLFQLEDVAGAETEWSRVMELDADGKFRSRAGEKLRLLKR